jgi:uncharacterized protein
MKALAEEKPRAEIRSAFKCDDLPAAAAWRHLDTRAGFEVVFPSRHTGGYRLDGHATGVEDGEAWTVRYTLVLDANWGTRTAHVVGRWAFRESEVHLESYGKAGWRVDGEPMPELAGCIDVDLEASACTNALPVHRLKLDVGQAADAPAVYLRTRDLRVERLEQRYARLPDVDGHSRYDYLAPSFAFGAVLVYDEYGFVLDYPGIAVRIA